MKARVNGFKSQTENFEFIICSLLEEILLLAPQGNQLGM